MWREWRALNFSFQISCLMSVMPNVNASHVPHNHFSAQNFKNITMKILNIFRLQIWDLSTQIYSFRLQYGAFCHFWGLTAPAHYLHMKNSSVNISCVFGGRKKIIPECIDMRVNKCCRNIYRLYWFTDFTYYKETQWLAGTNTYIAQLCAETLLLKTKELNTSAHTARDLP